jgi:hypothetical protein
MSVELTVYLPRAAMPSPSEWASAIRERGFDVELGTDLDVDEFSGFLPCRFEGEDAGFEYESGPIEFVDELELPSDFDFAVTFATHSSMRDLGTSVVCAGVLCALTRGVLVDPQADMTVSADEAVAWAREMLDEIG